MGKIILAVSMEKVILSVVITIAVLIFLIILSIIIYNVIRTWRIGKMYSDCDKVLQSLINPTLVNEYRIERITSKDPYDYIFKTPNHNYYIQVVPNFNSYEICINNSVKWQIRKSFNDNSMNFVPNVDKLMPLDLEDPKSRKLYIIYPNATSLLKYINECEMVFVRPETDVYGTNVISYAGLKEKPELFDKIDKI